MKTVQFKTNINCEGCIEKMAPFMSANEQIIKSWVVDTTSREKILTVETEGSAEDIRLIVEKAGFKAEKL